MVEIIERKSGTKECNCRNCDSKLRYMPSEVKYHKHTDYGGFTETYTTINCPVCNQKTEVSR